MSTEQYEVRAGLVEVEPFTVAGVSIITQRDKATEDINALWERFFKESVGQFVPGKIDDVIYAVYSDYEGDHEAPYRFTIGYRVEKEVNGDFYAVTCNGGEYAMMSAAGKQPDALIETWNAIWSSDLDRAYTQDFEIYGPRFFEDGVNEVLVHVGVKSS